MSAHVRRVFNSRLNIFLFTLSTVIFFWLAEAFINTLYFQDASFVHVLLLDKNDVWSRIFFSISFFAFGYIMSQAIDLKNKSEKAINKSEEWFSALINSTDDSIYLIDRKYRYLFINDAHLKRLGISRNESKNKPFSRFHSEEATRIFIKRINSVFNLGNSAQYEYKSQKDGAYFLQNFSPVVENNKIIAVSVLSKNVSKLKKMEKELRTLSMTDELTSVYNRRGFFTIARQNLKIASRLGKQAYLLSADLDNLKEINDSLGHKNGDRALSEAASVLKSVFRESDVVARIGGDEFAVLHIGNADIGEKILADRLKQRIISVNSEEGRRYNLSLSIGIIKADLRNADSLDDLLIRADKKMYQTKKLKKKESVLKAV